MSPTGSCAPSRSTETARSYLRTGIRDVVTPREQTDEMGKNNRQRRATKRRERARCSGPGRGPASSPPRGDDMNQ
ncbi:MAG: hypothetical protein QOF30_2310, partial [Acidimicrobiaceae bacterium]|nr:hypothetical protein [Acidimicrobiaceae bacterium]